MKKVFCIGELLIDFVAENQGNDLSKADVFTKKAGGAPANVACAIAKLGGLGKFIGCVGKDQFGSFLLSVLEDNQILVWPNVQKHLLQLLLYPSLKMANVILFLAEVLIKN